MIPFFSLLKNGSLIPPSVFQCIDVLPLVAQVVLHFDTHLGYTRGDLAGLFMIGWTKKGRDLGRCRHVRTCGI